MKNGSRAITSQKQTLSDAGVLRVRQHDAQRATPHHIDLTATERCRGARGIERRHQLHIDTLGR